MSGKSKKNLDPDEDNLDYASDHDCCECGEQADYFWGLSDPDMRKSPYCEGCLAEVRHELFIELSEYDPFETDLDG